MIHLNTLKFNLVFENLSLTWLNALNNKLFTILFNSNFSSKQFSSIKLQLSDYFNYFCFGGSEKLEIEFELEMLFLL